MKNIDIKIAKNKMTIEIDLSKNFGKSKSGKTTIIASSEGNKMVAPDVYVGLNIYKKGEAAE